MRNYYNVLGVSRNATQQEIKKMYHKAISQSHPDKQHGRNEADKAPQDPALINEAYQALSSSVRRAELDQWLSLREAPPIPKAPPGVEPPLPSEPPHPQPSKSRGLVDELKGNLGLAGVLVVVVIVVLVQMFSSEKQTSDPPPRGKEAISSPQSLSGKYQQARRLSRSLGITLHDSSWDAIFQKARKTNLLASFRLLSRIHVSQCLSASKKNDYFRRIESLWQESPPLLHEQLTRIEKDLQKEESACKKSLVEH
jgi:hypothetical protein